MRSGVIKWKNSQTPFENGCALAQAEIQNKLGNRFGNDNYQFEWQKLETQIRFLRKQIENLYSGASKEFTVSGNVEKQRLNYIKADKLQKEMDGLIKQRNKLEEEERKKEKSFNF